MSATQEHTIETTEQLVERGSVGPVPVRIFNLGQDMKAVGQDTSHGAVSSAVVAYRHVCSECVRDRDTVRLSSNSSADSTLTFVDV